MAPDKTSKEGLTVLMHAYDKLSDFHHKPHRPKDHEAVDHMKELLEQIIKDNGYQIRYPNGKTPKLVEIK